MPLLLLKYWKVGAALLLVVGLVFWHVSALNKARHEGVMATEALWRIQTQKEVAEANHVAEEAKAEAERERAASAKAREDEAQRERDRQAQQAQERDKLIHDWQSRMRAAIANNQECAAWSNIPIACPVL